MNRKNPEIEAHVKKKNDLQQRYKDNSTEVSNFNNNAWNTEHSYAK